MSVGKIALYLVPCVVLATGVFFYFHPPQQQGNFAEAATIAEGAADFKQLSDRFENLAKEKGGVYAYEILRRAALPPNTDLHLLGHVVGDQLYKEKGVPGIADCTQDFRNACSHSIVVGALNDFGEAALPMIRDACHKAPGGSGAYTMCYHGLGHGVFAFFEYDIPQTVAMCKKTGSKEYGDREYVECVGGMVMELMGGGGHDHDAWLKSREKYLTKDPLAPCDSDLIPNEAKDMCYTYISPRLFEFGGGDLGNPQPAQFKRAFEYCDRIPKSKTRNRYSCFSGIGKEFPVLAVDRDVRAISASRPDALSKMREWCALSPHDEAYHACTESITDSLFWGGENDPMIAITFCSLADGNETHRCLAYLFKIAGEYVPKNQDARDAFCARIPDNERDACSAALAL